MKLYTLLVINGVIALLFGLAFIFMPATLLHVYGVEMTPPGLFIARLLGASFAGYAIISFIVRNSEGSNDLSAILLGIAVGDLLGFVITLVFMLQGGANPAGWINVALYLLLGLGFAYFYWRKA